MKSKKIQKPQITRMTNQRHAILEYLKKVKTHPTAEEIYTYVKKGLPHISFGTVYRNLKILKTQGEIQELAFESKAHRFDAMTKNHVHYNCINCDKVLDIEMDKNHKKCLECMRKLLPGKVEKYQIEIYGSCKACVDKKKQRKK